MILQLHLIITTVPFRLSFHYLPLSYYRSHFVYHRDYIHFIISSFLILCFSILYYPSPDNTTPSLFLYRPSLLFFQNIISIYLLHVLQVLSSHLFLYFFWLLFTVKAYLRTVPLFTLSIFKIYLLYFKSHRLLIYFMVRLIIQQRRNFTIIRT